jgi:GT2 family glycosyltransferase
MLEKLDRPLVSIVVLNFNGRKYVKDCLSSIFETDYSSFEVIFVDNGSTDGSLSAVEKSFGRDSRLRILRIEENRGASAGNNFGFEHASGSYIAFLNNDTMVDAQWLTCLLEAFEQDRTIGLAQSAILEMTGDSIQTNGLLIGDYYLFGYPIGRGKPIGTKYPFTFEVSFAGGAAMIMDRKLAEERGLFDPIVQFYYDDILMSIKAWLSGRRVVSVPKSLVYHAGGKTTSSSGSQTHYGALFLEAKICVLFDVYYRFQDLVKAFFFFGYSFLLELVYYVLKKKFSDVSARVHALQWTLRNFEAIWRNRNSHWSNAKIAPETLLDKFIRIRVPSAAYYLLPPSRWRKYCENEARKYEAALLQSCR